MCVYIVAQIPPVSLHISLQYIHSFTHTHTPAHTPTHLQLVNLDTYVYNHGKLYVIIISTY